jgi:hypothetical protein
MALENMQVFNQYLMDATIETLGQMVDKFNGSSNGSIILSSEGFDGDFFERSFYQALHTSQRRVDRYAANGAQSGTNLAQLKESAVKVAGGFGPILFEPAQMAWIRKSEAEAIAVISSNLAEAMLQDELNTAIKALVAAISNQADATNDVSGSAGIDYPAINGAHAKFGDRSLDLVAQVMNGATYHKLVGLNLANTPQLFQAQNVTVVEILGKPVIVTDAPDLYEAGSPNKDKVLSLATGAATIMDGSQVVSNIETSNGKDRIETTMQADYDFGLALRGYTWDTANGGKSPTDSEIGTGSNWDKVATDIKATAGVITIGDNAA